MVCSSGDGVSVRKQVALITGAAGGIGRELVAAFARRYYVVALDRTSKPVDLVEADYLQVDLNLLVTDEDYAAKAMNQISAALGGRLLAVLINNAAVQILGGVATLSRLDWQRTLHVNLLAPFILTQALIGKLEAADGCVINISSIHARLTKPDFVAYATSKAALSGLTRAMAVDLGSRVRVNAIEPAAIETEMLRSGFNGDGEQLRALAHCHPQGRLGTPAEVAALALSLASGELRFLHGACVGLDGGISGRLHDPL